MGRSPSHFDAEGKARMVDVSAKPITTRRAIARGIIRLNKAAMRALVDQASKKGDVLAVAQVAAIMATKKLPELVPLCHNIPIEKVSVDFDVDEKAGVVACQVTVLCSGKTGVEMEALLGVQIGLLAIYDMLKSLDRTMSIEGVTLVKKTGGRSAISNL